MQSLTSVRVLQTNNSHITSIPSSSSCHSEFCHESCCCDTHLFMRPTPHLTTAAGQRCIKSLLISFGYENSISPRREKLELWNFKHTVSDPLAMQQRSMHLCLHVPCCTGSLGGVSMPFVVTGSNANYDDDTQLHTGTRTFSLHFHAVIFYLKFHFK